MKWIRLLWDLINAIINLRIYSKLRMYSKARSEQSSCISALYCWKGSSVSLEATGIVLAHTLPGEQKLKCKNQSQYFQLTADTLQQHRNENKIEPKSKITESSILQPWSLLRFFPEACQREPTEGRAKVSFTRPVSTYT